MFIDINKYVSNTNSTPDKIVSTQCDFNLIEIYLLYNIQLPFIICRNRSLLNLEH